MSHQRRLGAIVLGAVLALTLATGVLAGASPSMSLSQGRGPVGTTVTMTMKNCTSPRLWDDPASQGIAAVGVAGYVQWANDPTGQRGYLYAGSWAAVGTAGTTWSVDLTMSLPTGKNHLWAWCGTAPVGTAFTVTAVLNNGHRHK